MNKLTLKDCFIYTLDMFESDMSAFCEDSNNSKEELDKRKKKALLDFASIWNNDLKEELSLMEFMEAQKEYPNIIRFYKDSFFRTNYMNKKNK